MPYCRLYNVEYIVCWPGHTSILEFFEAKEDKKKKIFFFLFFFRVFFLCVKIPKLMYVRATILSMHIETPRELQYEAVHYGLTGGPVPS